MTSELLKCPDCQSEDVVKNGKTHSGKQNYRCNECRRQFVKNPQNKSIHEDTKHLIDKLLAEKVPLLSISRIVDVSEPWLRKYISSRK